RDRNVLRDPGRAAAARPRLRAGRGSAGTPAERCPQRTPVAAPLQFGFGHSGQADRAERPSRGGRWCHAGELRVRIAAGGALGDAGAGAAGATRSVLYGIARLKPGISIASAAAEMDAIGDPGSGCSDNQYGQFNTAAVTGPTYGS